jgi:anthranilate/para-aminobenzoate synthase component II
MDKLKIYVVGADYSYVRFLEQEIVNTIQEADIVFFTGGEDVTPSLYGAKTNRLSYYNTDRDDYEMKIFKKALALDKYIIGVCRGSQFLCTMAGGKLFQDISHPSVHNIVTNEGEIIPSSSTHHQMQYPFNLPKEEYDILAWAQIQSPKHYIEEDIQETPLVDPEVVWYPKIKALAFQPHPEYSWCPTECTQYFKKLINKYVRINRLCAQKY